MEPSGPSLIHLEGPCGLPLGSVSQNQFCWPEFLFHNVLRLTLLTTVAGQF